MTQEVQILVLGAASIGFFHTLLGPDHYLPFILIGKARNWKMGKIIFWTLVCGLGHILSSVLLGAIGIGLELQLGNLEWFESVRGDLAAWALIAFGLLYALWGIRHWYKKTDHHHTVAKHGDNTKLTPWVLFIIFVLGPCELLIPILMYPAVVESYSALILVTSVFGIVTLITMIGVVLVTSYGLSFIPIKKVEKYSHSVAGMVIFLSGVAIQVLGI